jgi:hypothetical protein
MSCGCQQLINGNTLAKVLAIFVRQHSRAGAGRTPFKRLDCQSNRGWYFEIYFRRNGGLSTLQINYDVN